MSYSDTQLQVLVTIWKNELQRDDVAVGYFRNEDKKIYVATSYKKWPPIVNLIQGVGSRHFRKEDIFTIAYCPPVSAAEGMTKGMIDFHNSFDFKLYPRPVAIPSDSPEYRAVADTGFSNSLQYFRVQPENVAERQTLDGVIVTSTGEPPNANLDNRFEARYYHRLYLALAYNRAGFRGMFRSPSTEIGHNIAAVFTTDNGQVLAVSYNKKNINDTFHAEVNLVQAIVKKYQEDDFHRKVFFIYTTLKPCKMCAAMIATIFPNARVIYGQNDPGRHAQEILRPRGGYVCSLSEVGAKPLYAYDDITFHQHNSVKREIAGLLAPAEGAVTATLNTIPSAKNMMRAGLSIHRKAIKYSEPGKVAKETHSKVPAILQHLQPLMTNW